MGNTHMIMQTRVMTVGTIRLDPPGITLTVESLFRGGLRAAHPTRVQSSAYQSA